jgi:diketogulonate reductase-like aldo/keto reductase
MISRRQLIRTAAHVGFAGGLYPSIVRSQSSLPERAIPNSGELVPVVALGTYRTFNVSPTPAALDPLRQVTEAFMAHGGRIVDSSPQYGPSEAMFGEVLRQIPNAPELFVATKVATEGREAGIRQMEASPRKMAVDAIDLMQIHNLRDWRSQLPTLRSWKAEGRIRYLGISASRETLYAEYIAIMRNEPLDFIQINYSVAERRSEDVILPLALERNIAVLINRPFVAGALFAYVRDRSLPDWAADFDCQSWAQFFLKYVLGHPAVTAVIQATTDVEHLLDNMGAAYGRMPNEATRARMAGLIGLTGRPPWA